jgi:LmbE family N-acetylglucosaminyl deacetylase
VRLVLLSLALFLAASADARMRALRHREPPPHPRSLLWVAAHPDDEAVVAPLLGAWCRDAQVRCGFLIVTRGEQGGCALPNDCVPDIPTVRAAEAGAASQLFNAELILLTLPDGGGAALPQWQSTESVAAYIEAFRPDMILTFDPRHGTTCHPDHREIGRIVVEAVRRLPFAVRLWLLETRVNITSDPLAIAFTSATPEAERFDARPGAGRPARGVPRAGGGDAGGAGAAVPMSLATPFSARASSPAFPQSNRGRGAASVHFRR